MGGFWRFAQSADPPKNQIYQIAAKFTFAAILTEIFLKSPLKFSFKFIAVSPASKRAATLKFDAIKPEFREIALNLPLKFS